MVGISPLGKGDQTTLRECPFCAEPIKPEAIKCKHCGSVLTKEARQALAREIAKPDEVEEQPEADDPLIPDEVATARMATVVFADITGYTALSRDHSPNEIREIMNTHFSEYVSVIEQYGGQVDKYIGDEVMAVWGTETVREENALRACRAALDMIERTHNQAERMDVPTDLHVGINTGRVVYGEVGGGENMEHTVMGDVVNLASRLCDVADSGSVMVGEETWARVKEQLSAEAREFDLKGIGTTTAYKITGTERQIETDQDTDSVVSRFVGRDRERERLDRVISGFRSGQSDVSGVVVQGKRGTGKSRLCRHVLQSYSEQVPILFSQCISSEVPVLGGVVSDWLQQWADHTDHVSIEAAVEARDLDEYSRFIELISSDEMGRSSLSDPAPEQAVDLLLELAADEPLILAVSDLHWADGLSLDVIQEMVEDSRVPNRLLLVGEGRPGDNWQSICNSSRVQQIQLESLTRRQFEDFLEDVFVDLPPKDWVETIWQQTDGVILHLVQLIDSLIEQGMLESGPDTNQFRVTETDRDLPVPDTLSDLLWSRIDRLPAGEQDLLLRASVCGFRFPRETLVLAADRDEDSMQSQIDRLESREFLVGSDGTLAFQNRFVRETALDMLLPGERRGLANQVLEELGGRRRSTAFRPILPQLLRQAERYNELREVQSIQAYQHLRAFRRDEAQELLEKAGEDSWGDEPKACKARASYLNARARLSEADNDLEQAMEYHRQAVDILRDLDEPNDLAHSLILVSRMAVKCKQWELAREVTEKSLEISRRQGLTGAVAKSTFMMGWLSEVQDDWETALKWFKKTLDQEGRESGMGRAYPVSGIARAYENLGRREEALPYHKESVDCLTHDEWMEKNPHVYALNLESCGWNEWDLNQSEEGIEYMRRSLKIALETSDAPVVASLLNRFVRVASEANQVEHAKCFYECCDRWIDQQSDNMGSYDPEDALERYES